MRRSLAGTNVRMRELTERDKSLRIGLAWHHMARHNAARGRWLLAAGAALGAGGGECGFDQGRGGLWCNLGG